MSCDPGSDNVRCMPRSQADLAHVLLRHSPAQADVAEDGSLILKAYNRDQEDEANCLAGALLLPRPALILIRRTQGDERPCQLD